MTSKTVAKIRKTFDQRNNELMASLWGNDLNSISRWNRKKYDGFSTLPRCLPIINRIMDKISDGKPISSTYLSLWFRVNDEGFIQIKDEKQLAIESGFDSERNISTWKTRMRMLEQFGFIVSKEGVKSKFQYVLIVNPFDVIQNLDFDDINKYPGITHSIKEKVEQYKINLQERMAEVGAKI